MRRRLTIRTKLAATLAVPLAALASFAALQVRDAYNRSDQVKLQAGLATSATGPAGVLTALENERDYEALRAIGEQNLVAPKNTKFSAQVTASTDVALGNFRLLLGDVGGDAAGNYRSTLTQVSTKLVQLRQLAEDRASKDRVGREREAGHGHLQSLHEPDRRAARRRSAFGRDDRRLRSAQRRRVAQRDRAPERRGVGPRHQGRARGDHTRSRRPRRTRSVSPTGRRRATPICTCAPTGRTNGPCSVRSTRRPAEGRRPTAGGRAQPAAAPTSSRC